MRYEYVFEIAGRKIAVKGDAIKAVGGKTPAVGISGNARRMLEVLLETERTREALTYAMLLERLSSSASQDTSGVRQLKGSIIRDIAKACPPLDTATIENAFELREGDRPENADARAKVFGYRGKIATYSVPEDITDRETQQARKRHEKEKEAGRHVNAIIDDLQAVCPERQGIFSTTTRGTRLPVYIPPSGDTTFPTFPIPVSTEQRMPSEDLLAAQEKRSLHRQRLAQGSNVYPGTIYTLHKGSSADWELGWTLYTDLIESCDQIAANLKEIWLDVRKSGITPEDRRARMGSGAGPDALGQVTNRWDIRASEVLNGRFDAYLAGIAFSAPTFRIEQNGSLTLLFAEGAPEKQSGAGQKHVCPAGMLEFWEPLGAGEALTLDQFKAIVAKELLEETVFGAKFALKEDSPFRLSVEKFSTETPGMMQASADDIMATLKGTILKGWDKIWQDFPAWQTLVEKKLKPPSPGLSPLRSILAFDPEVDPCFLAIDALCFRPELIVPLYQFDPLSALVNWEYKHHGRLDDAFETYTWETEQELEDWVAQERPNWCAPGIAAAYLGARHYFQEREACIARARVRTNPD